MIGLVGDRLKFRAGQQDYMTHMAVMYTNEISPTALAEAQNNSTKAPYLLPIKVDPSLYPDKYTPEQWRKLHDITKQRAADILGKELAEGLIRPTDSTSDILTSSKLVSRNYFNNFDYIIDLLDNNNGPQEGGDDEKIAFVRRTMRQQEEFLKQFHVITMLNELNNTLLHGKGTIGFRYGGIRNNGLTTSTELFLQIDPTKGNDSPHLMIGLVGDGQKFAHAEDNYMTHLALMYVDQLTIKNLENAEKEALIAITRIPIVPSLNPESIDPAEFTRIQDSLQQRATTLLRAKLEKQERRSLRGRLRRGAKVAAIASPLVALVGGAIKIEQETQVVEKVIIPWLKKLPLP